MIYIPFIFFFKSIQISNLIKTYNVLSFIIYYNDCWNSCLEVLELCKNSYKSWIIIDEGIGNVFILVHILNLFFQIPF